MITASESKVKGGEGSYITHTWYNESVWPIASHPSASGSSVNISGRVVDWNKIQFRRHGHLSGYLRSKRGNETMERMVAVVIDVLYMTVDGRHVSKEEFQDMMRGFGQSIIPTDSEDDPFTNDLIAKGGTSFVFWGNDQLIARLKSESEVSRDFPLAGNDEVSFDTIGSTLLINPSSMQITVYGVAEEKKHEGFTPGMNRQVTYNMKKSTEYKTSENAVRVDEGFTSNIMKFKNTLPPKEESDSDSDDWS